MSDRSEILHRDDISNTTEDARIFPRTESRSDFVVRSPNGQSFFSSEKNKAAFRTRGTESCECSSHRFSARSIGDRRSDLIYSR
jgi:hypothetical protein